MCSYIKNVQLNCRSHPWVLYAASQSHRSLWTPSCNEMPSFKMSYVKRAPQSLLKTLNASVIYALPPAPRAAPKSSLSLLDFLAQSDFRHSQDKAYEFYKPMVPRLLLHYFPKPTEGMGVPDITSYRTLMFCLKSCASQPNNRFMYPFLNHMVTLLQQGCFLASAISSTSGCHDKKLVSDLIVEPLLRKQAVMCEGGYFGSETAHSAAVYFLPLPGKDTILCVVLNRGEGSDVYHCFDGDNHPKPWIIALNKNILKTPAVQAALMDLIALQRCKSTHTIYAFYSVMYRLKQACQAHMLLGQSEKGEKVVCLNVPGQSWQKSSTCALHSILSLLYFVVCVDRKAIDTAADPYPVFQPLLGFEAQTIYKDLKRQCREIMLRHVIHTIKQADQKGDKVWAAELRYALRQACQWMEPRLSRHAELQPMYGMALKGLLK